MKKTHKKKSIELSEKDILFVLDDIYNSDWYAEYFFYSKYMLNLGYNLIVLDLIYINSLDNRVLLTLTGEKLLQKLNCMLI